MKLGFIAFILFSFISTGFAKPGHAVGVAKGSYHTTAVPPGLKHRSMPVGLERRGMTPPGWSRGKAYWKNPGQVRAKKINKGRHIH